MTTPAVSVIVPVRDRPDLLARCLQALAGQTFKDLEVIVIDDGSTDPVRPVVESAGVRGLPVVYERTTGVGAVEARCVGVGVARGRIFAFTDSDCEPEPGWIESGVCAIDAGADVVQGVTVPVREPRLFERSLAYRGGEGLFATCNVFYRRDAFESADGFDRRAVDRFRFRTGNLAKGLGFGEDALLGWRVARTGSFAVAENAVVRHAVNADHWREIVSRTWQIGAFPALVREIPELRTTLLRSRLFIGSDSRVPLYLAALMLLTPIRSLAAIPAAWWASRVWRRMPQSRDPRARRVAAFPAFLLLDAIRAVALIVGSVRTRTPVL